MVGKKKEFNDEQVRRFAAAMLKESLALILPVTGAVNELMRPHFKEYLDENKFEYTDKTLEASLSTASLSWSLAFYLEFYIEEIPKYKQSTSYKYFLQKLLDEIDTASNGTLNLKEIKAFAVGTASNAIGAMAKGGPYLMWWDMFFCLNGINVGKLPPPALIENMEMAGYATEIFKQEVEKSAKIKKAFLNIILV